MLYGILSSYDGFVSGSDRVIMVSLQAVAKMVQECYKYVDAVSDLTTKLRLIDTLRTVTAGKVGHPAAL